MRNCVAVWAARTVVRETQRDEEIPVVGTVPGVFPRSTPNREPEFRARLMAAHRRTRYKRERKYRHGHTGYWDGAQGFPAVDPKPRA